LKHSITYIVLNFQILWMTLDGIKLELAFNWKSTLEVDNDIPIGQGGPQVEDIFQLLTILVNDLT
jgi:hypothetical protein